MRQATNEVMTLLQGDFNSRTHKGCDIQAFEFIEQDNKISIHAPIKDATVLKRQLVMRPIKFQFTHP